MRNPCTLVLRKECGTSSQLFAIHGLSCEPSTLKQLRQMSPHLRLHLLIRDRRGTAVVVLRIDPLRDLENLWRALFDLRAARQTEVRIDPPCDPRDARGLIHRNPRRPAQNLRG